jgi:hypothetical protein
MNSAAVASKASRADPEDSIAKNAAPIGTSAYCAAPPGTGWPTWCAGYRENATIGAHHSFRVVRTLNVP